MGGGKGGMGGGGGHWGGGGWRGGWGGYPGWGWGGLYWDRDVIIDATTPAWSNCKLTSPVKYFDNTGTARSIPSGTIVQSTPDGGGYVKINYGGQIIRSLASGCEPVSGADGKKSKRYHVYSSADGKRYHVYSSADAGMTDMATAQKLAIEKKVQAGFAVAGLLVGLSIAYKHQGGLIDKALMAVFGLGAGTVVGWAAKGSVATLFMPKVPVGIAGGTPPPAVTTP